MSVRMAMCSVLGRCNIACDARSAACITNKTEKKEKKNPRENAESSAPH
jgi:hypothetical protein